MRLHRIGTLLAACWLALMPSQAGAVDFKPRGLYIAFHTGFAATRDADTSLPAVPTSGELAFDESITFAGAAGLRLTDHFRVEGEVNYRRPDIDSATLLGVPTVANGHVSTWALMLNTYYDFRPKSRLNPFISAGIGIARHSGDLRIGAVTADKTDTSFAWQLGGGLSYAMTDRLDLTAGYRYFNTGSPDFTTIKTENDAHEFRAGLVYKLQP